MMEEPDVKTPLLQGNGIHGPEEREWPGIPKKFFATALLAAFLATADESFVLSTSREIAGSFGQMSASTWLITGYSLGYLVSLPVYGQLCNIYGRRPTLLLAYSMFGIGCFLIGISPTVTVAVAGRIISGFGASGMMDLLSVFLNEMAPPHKVPLLRSYVSMISMVGRCSGAPLGSLLATVMGWQWSFLVHVPAVLFCILGAVAYIPLTDTDQPSRPSNKREEDDHEREASASNSRSLNIAGIIMLGGAITAFLLLLQHLDPQELASTPKSTIIILGTSCLAFATAFLAFETWGTNNPLIPLSLLRKNKIGIICLVTALLHAGYIIIYSNISEFYVRSTNVSVPVASSFLLPFAIGGAIGSVLAGIVIRKTCKNRLPSIAGTILAATSFSMILVRWCFATSLHQWELIYTFTGGFGIGCAMSSQFFSLSISVTSKEDNAIAVTAYYLFQQIGAIMGVSMVNTLQRHLFKSNLRANIGSNPRNLEMIEHILSDSQYVQKLSPPLIKMAHSAFRMSFSVIPLFALCAYILALSFNLAQKGHR